MKNPEAKITASAGILDNCAERMRTQQQQHREQRKRRVDHPARGYGYRRERRHHLEPDHVRRLPEERGA